MLARQNRMPSAGSARKIRPAVIEARGEIDLLGAQALRKAMADEPARHVIVDLSQVTFCDASGLGALVAARKRLLAEGGSIQVVGANTHIRRLFEITGLDRVFPLHENLDEAFAA
ncbi:STAS domain-containing protein [Rhizohabitans arisaemae]|uniref:STAS domain-containing protein n=1 Tax=Rhizohabitans arisaemae TaxID=2720610 RepID=UPI0024B1A96B|nr:STAS domain-containing protein [Rhizohabitans arisaemae]